VGIKASVILRLFKNGANYHCNKLLEKSWLKNSFKNKPSKVGFLGVTVLIPVSTFSERKKNWTIFSEFFTVEAQKTHFRKGKYSETSVIL
jgi:hypothetical protein